MQIHEFTDILAQCKLFTLPQAQSKLNQLNTQLETVNDLYTGHIEGLERMILSSVDIIADRDSQMHSITYGPLLIQQTLLREHQKQRSNSNVALVTVAKIAEQKQFLNRLEMDIKQVKLRIAKEAKNAAASAKEYQRVKREVSRAQTMVSLHQFLIAHGKTPEAIASHEIYELYSEFKESGM